MEHRVAVKEEEEQRFKAFREKAQEQRQKIYTMKATQDDFTPESVEQEIISKQEKLTEENLSKMDAKSQASRASKKSKTSKKAKPAWATTEKQLEDEKEAEIDDLLEFAYELDYDKYMDDFEVRQVFSIIKDRVKEIKEDRDWKNKVVEEWNENVPAEP